MPTPDEVQVAVVQAMKLVVNSLKSVAQWTLTFTNVAEDDRRPTTSGTRPITGSVDHVTQLYAQI